MVAAFSEADDVCAPSVFATSEMRLPVLATAALVSFMLFDIRLNAPARLPSSSNYAQF